MPQPTNLSGGFTSIGHCFWFCNDRFTACQKYNYSWETPEAWKQCSNDLL